MKTSYIQTAKVSPDKKVTFFSPLRLQLFSRRLHTHFPPIPAAKITIAVFQ